MSTITTLFFDVGGVLLTYGWDHVAREKGGRTVWDYDYEESEAHHQEVAQRFECGQMNQQDYLQQVVFFADRPFAEGEFVRFYGTAVTAARGLVRSAAKTEGAGKSTNSRRLTTSPRTSTTIEFEILS